MGPKHHEIRDAMVHEGPRAMLLRATRQFVQAAQRCNGVRRIALIGSLTTTKAVPKDTDLLVTIDHPMDIAPLARVGRRLQGGLQSQNLGADIFLSNADGAYIGRICHFRECHPRMACRAEHCARHPHLNDDLHVVTLSSELIGTPPVELWPHLVRNCHVPADVELLLIEKIEEVGISGEQIQETHGE
jgi:predicted nucleotidyltransferase